MFDLELLSLIAAWSILLLGYLWSAERRWLRDRTALGAAAVTTEHWRDRWAHSERERGHVLRSVMRFQHDNPELGDALDRALMVREPAIVELAEGSN